MPDGGLPDAPAGTARGAGVQPGGEQRDDDWQDTFDRHPVADQAVTRSLFDDEDRINDHPTGP